MAVRPDTGRLFGAALALGLFSLSRGEAAFADSGVCTGGIAPTEMPTGESVPMTAESAGTGVPGTVSVPCGTTAPALTERVTTAIAACACCARCTAPSDQACTPLARRMSAARDTSAPAAMTRRLGLAQPAVCESGNAV